MSDNDWANTYLLAALFGFGSGHWLCGLVAILVSILMIDSLAKGE